MSRDWTSPFQRGGDYEILPDEKNFHVRRKIQVPKADVDVPSGLFAIDGDEGEEQAARLKKTKTRIAAQKTPERVTWGVGSVLVLGMGLVLGVGALAGKRR